MAEPSPLYQGVATLPQFPALDYTVGAWFIATFIGITLYGITLQQSFRYYRLYPDDDVVLKALVVVILILETFHTILCAHVCYFYTGIRLADPLGLLTTPGPWTLQTLPLAAGATIFVAHGFFARRIFLFGQKYCVLLLIAIVLIVGELGFSCAASVKAYFLTSLDDFSKAIWLIATATAMTAITDIFLTCVLMASLHKSRTGYKNTDSLINTLILYAIGTGLVTSISILLSFIFSVIFPSKEIYAAFSMGGTKLYANTVFVALNSRKSFQPQPSCPAAETAPFSWHVSPPSRYASAAIELQTMPPPCLSHTASRDVGTSTTGTRSLEATEMGDTHAKRSAVLLPDA
ncbi:hypothetical protein BD413DRAFT_616421 [Trametes elegans]|nr:hypothetical protein BD413DRAFT_616421 [Trametes elegans]